LPVGFNMCGNGNGLHLPPQEAAGSRKGSGRSPPLPLPAPDTIRLLCAGERRSYAHLSEEDNYLDNTLGEDQDNEFNEDLADPFIEDFASQEMEMRSFPTKATTQLPPLAGGMEDEGGQEAVDMFADTRQFRPWVELDDDGANDHRVDDGGGGVGNASGSNEEVDLFAERNT